MGKRMKLYPILLDDLIPIMIIGFGYNQEEVFRRIKNKFPAIVDIETIIYHKPIPINTSTIFALDAELELLSDNRDIQACLNYDELFDDEGFFIPLREIETEIIEGELEEKKEEEKSDDKDKESGKKAKWA